MKAFVMLVAFLVVMMWTQIAEAGFRGLRSRNNDIIVVNAPSASFQSFQRGFHSDAININVGRRFFIPERDIFIPVPSGNFHGAPARAIRLPDGSLLFIR